MKLARHEDVEGRVEVPNSTLTTKAILLAPICVTQENAKQTVIKDGFQKLEVVKQSLPKTSRHRRINHSTGLEVVILHLSQNRQLRSSAQGQAMMSVMGMLRPAITLRTSHTIVPSKLR